MLKSLCVVIFLYSLTACSIPTQNKFVPITDSDKRELIVYVLNKAIAKYPDTTKVIQKNLSKIIIDVRGDVITFTVEGDINFEIAEDRVLAEDLIFWGSKAAIQDAEHGDWGINKIIVLFDGGGHSKIYSVDNHERIKKVADTGSILLVSCILSHRS